MNEEEQVRQEIEAEDALEKDFQKWLDGDDYDEDEEYDEEYDSGPYTDFLED